MQTVIIFERALNMQGSGHNHPEDFNNGGLPPHHKHFHEEELEDHGKPVTHKNYTPIPWQACFDELFYLSDGTSVFRAGNEGPIFFCIHGAGHSALSFAMLAREAKQFGTFLAYDLKGHGASKKLVSTDFSIETLCAQAIQTLKEIMQRFQQQNIIVVGHSLGGSIACRIVDVLTNVQKLERVVGCVVIDVVEGTAIEALPFMNQVIADRPKHFDSLQTAIKWSFGSCNIRKLQSARVSIPAQLIEQQKNGVKRWGWKVHLLDTQIYWLGWFKGLSHIFLNIHVPKILLTAQKERLDKELTIAQMQGKFKVVVIHNVGHSVQEDDYHTTAKELFAFVKDFRIPMTLSERAEKELVGIANFHPHLLKF